METLRKQVNIQYRTIRHRIPSELLEFTDRADWRFIASFLLLFQRKESFSFNEFAVYSLVCKIKRVWIEPYLSNRFKAIGEGKLIAGYNIRLPLSDPWDFWRSVRAQLPIPDEAKTPISISIRQMKKTRVPDIQARCAVIAYIETKKTMKISQEAIANLFRIPLSRFRTELSSYKKNDQKELH